MTDPTLNHWDHLGPIDTRALDAACREQLPPGCVRVELTPEQRAGLSNADWLHSSAFAPGEPAPSWCVPTVVYLSLLGLAVLSAVVAVIGGMR